MVSVIFFHSYRTKISLYIVLFFVLRKRGFTAFIFYAALNTILLYPIAGGGVPIAVEQQALSLAQDLLTSRQKAAEAYLKLVVGIIVFIKN